jgi:hypothetical protein
MPKHEGRDTFSLFVVRAADYDSGGFVIRASFVIRHSGFVIWQCDCGYAALGFRD